MVIVNGLVYGEDCRFSPADLAYEGGRITRIAPAGSLPAGDAIDAGGGYVLPGFVDIHTHGAAGADICDGDARGIERMLAEYASCGVTSVVAATASVREGELRAALRAARGYIGADGYGAVLRGINLEGPFLNPQKCGAQNPSNIIAPNAELLDELCEECGGGVRMVGVAPEMPGALDFIRRASRRCVVSVAHTEADYGQAAAAFEAGAAHVTHLFNAMPPFLHREPGVVGAAADFAEHVELVADGAHLHPSVLRAAFALFGERRVCLVSDSIRGAGMPEGEYDLGGLRVVIKGGEARLAQGGALAGSVTSLAGCCRGAVRHGVPLEQAVRAATLNPAQAAGLQSEVGSLMPGKRADIVIWNRDMQACEVIAGGVRLLD